MGIVKTKKCHKIEPFICVSTHGDVFFSKGFTMPKPKERKQIIKDIHIKLGHFNEQHTMVEIQILGIIGTTVLGN
jgi:hypothetical protein